MPWPNANRVLAQVVVLGLGNLLLFVTFKWLLRQMEPNREVCPPKKKGVLSLSPFLPLSFLSPSPSLPLMRVHV